MFNLENTIKSWKRKLRTKPAFEDGDIAELESHLREEIERLKSEGLSEEEAFKKAVKEIGEPEPISDEFYKSRATQKAGPVPPWKQKAWLPAILPNYVKISLRNFKRNPVFSTINVLGLSIALAVALLVITFAKDQADYDTFHTQSDQIYRITSTIKVGGSSNSEYASSPYVIASVLNDELPEVLKTTHIQPFSGAVSFQNKRFRISGFQADSSFFDLFDFPLSIGNPERALENPNSIILTQETANRFFANADPLRKVLKLDDGQSYQVTGVFAEFKNRSHLEFGALISVPSNTLTMSMNTGLQSWTNPTWYTYMLLQEGTDTDDLEERLSQVTTIHYPGNTDSGYELNLQHLNDINLGERMERQIGRITPIEFVYFLSALAFVVVLASCVNYVNLSVARSMKRLKEIGVRKVIGAVRLQLMGQFLVESVVVAIISLMIELLIFWGWLLPSWNSLQLATADFGKIAFNTSRDKELYLFFFGFTVLVGFLAGIYPAVKLSSFTPINAFKNHLSSGRFSGWSFRKLLVIFQISLSLVLIISTLLLYKQSNMLLGADYGFNKTNVINVELGDTSYELFRQDALNQTGVEGVSAISSLPGVDFPTRNWVNRGGRTDSISAAIYSVDEHFQDNFGLTLIAGRNFSTEYATDTQNAAIVNETAVKQFGFNSARDAVGGMIIEKDMGNTFQIIGVVKDFNFDFLWNPVSPLVMLNNPSEFNFANIQIRKTNQAAVLQNLEEIWKEYSTIAPFNYQYYSTEIDSVYTDFEELVFLIALLALLAIFLACFGLLAMTHYDAQARIKEVGVRKVFGAGIKDVVLLLSRDFTKLVAIAIILGVPTALYLNSLWLQVFANKVGLNIWTIALGIALTLILTLGTIALLTYRSAIMNPVKSLRSE